MQGLTPSLNLDRVLNAVIRVNADLEIKFVSEAGQRWLGYENATAHPRNFLDLLHPMDVQKFKDTLPAGHEMFTCDVRILKAGLACWVNIRGYSLSLAHQFVVCLIDISPWKSDTQALQQAADRDELTDLPNRSFLKRAVDELIQPGHSKFALALLDLDGFKRVNDTFGHLTGDAVLVETARRLTKIVTANDVVARLGGDEFVLLFPDKDATQVQATMREVLFAIARPYDTARHKSYLGASIGVAEYPAHGTDHPSLLNSADIAMYRAKNEGKNRINVYSARTRNTDFSIETAIHEGIEEGEFTLAYQPQYDMDCNITGAEALMRWTSRTLGPVSPARFIPIAEEAGLMPLLGKWALRSACYYLKQFQKIHPKFVISVNVSPVQFGEENFHVPVMNAMTEMGIDPAHVVLEITESTLMHSREETERSLMILRENGIRFSIDDFGTGFSSLSYLTRFPVSSLKIDKSFISKIEQSLPLSLTDHKLVKAMINLAHSIDLKVVAEGVETQAQFDFLKASGCNLVQGYLLGKPMSDVAMIEMLGHKSGVLA